MHFLIPLSCWLKWLILKPASHSNLAAIMDNKYCPEKKQVRQGLNIVVSPCCKRSSISSWEPSSGKAWGESGPQNNIAKNLLIRKPLKLVQSTEAFPALALFLLWVFCPEHFPELPGLLPPPAPWKGSKQKGGCCVVLVVPKNLVTDWQTVHKSWVVSFTSRGSRSHGG